MRFERACTNGTLYHYKVYSVHNPYNCNTCHQAMCAVPQRGILEIRTPFWPRFRPHTMHGESMRKEKYIEHEHKVIYDGCANNPSQVQCMMMVMVIDTSGCMMYEGLTQTTH